MTKFEWNPPKIPKIKAVFTSKPDYSFDVHFGQKRVDGTEMPARGWYYSALAEFDPEQVFIEESKANQLSPIDQLVDKTFRSTAEKLHEVIKQQLLDKKWDWDRVTIRQSGEVVHTPRNIFDTGTLYRGQKLDIVVDEQ